MGETKKRNVHLPEFKATVGLDAVRGVMTINEISQVHRVRPAQVSQWKREIQEQSKTFSRANAAPSRSAPQSDLEHGHHLHPFGIRHCLLGGHHRLVFAPSAELAYQQQRGSGVVRAGVASG